MLLVLSSDGKGIVMRPDALRTRTATRRPRGPQAQDQAVGRREAQPQADGGDRRGLRRQASAPHGGRHPRLATPEGHEPAPGPVAANKWLCASIVKDAGSRDRRVFDEAERRDPKHRRTWVALVDGNNHQIQRIKYEARNAGVKVTIIVDFVHVLEYLWNAAGCLSPRRDPAAEQWVHRQATRVLEGHATQGRRHDPPHTPPTPPGPRTAASPPTTPPTT